MSVYKTILNDTLSEKRKYSKMINKMKDDRFLSALLKKDSDKIPHILARFFLDLVSDHIKELMDEFRATGDEDMERYISNLYMSYQDMLGGDSMVEIYLDDLPEEAQF